MMEVIILKGKFFIIVTLALAILFIAGCSTNKPSSISQYEYLNIPWNASVEEVISALEQLEQEVYVGDIETLNGVTTQTIVIEGFNAFGCATEFTLFRFEGYGSSKNIGLASIQFFYNEDVNTNALKTNIANTYGESVPSFNEYLGCTANGDIWKTVTSTDQITYWYSDIKLNDIVSSKEKRIAWDYFKNIDNTPYDQESFELFMGQPVANIVLNTQYAHPEWYSEIVITMNGKNSMLLKQIISE